MGTRGGGGRGFSPHASPRHVSLAGSEVVVSTTAEARVSWESIPRSMKVPEVEAARLGVFQMHYLSRLFLAVALPPLEEG